MGHYKFIIVLLAVWLSFCSFGCVGPKNKRMVTHFYTLNYEPPEKITETPMPYCISIEPFEAAPPFDSTRMIFTSSLFSINSYSFDVWMTSPADMATYFIARDARSSGIVEAVMIADNRAATHRMTGGIDSFLEQDYKDGWKAVLSISITLIKLNEENISKQICLQKDYKMIEPCDGKNPEGVAKAMSVAMSKISLALIRDLQSVLAN